MAKVEVLWEDENENPRVAPATIEDKSHGGFSLRMKDPVGDGTHITIQWGDEHVSGIVTNCRREKSQFLVGVRRAT